MKIVRIKRLYNMEFQYLGQSAEGRDIYRCVDNDRHYEVIEKQGFRWTFRMLPEATEIRAPEEKQKEYVM